MRATKRQQIIAFAVRRRHAWLPERLKKRRSRLYYRVCRNGMLPASLTHIDRFSVGCASDTPRRIQNCNGGSKVMKYLLSGVAIVAALAIIAPASAQRSGPGATAGTGTGPGVIPPGGLGPSSPLSNLPGPGAPGYAYPPGAQPPAGMAPGMAPGATTSAEPPVHRHARASTHHHGMAAHPPSQMAGGNADQLNQEELARVSAGNFSMPPAPPGPEPSASNPDVGPGRAARRARQ